MVRTACADLPAFPLQLLLLRQPGWRAAPAAVVDRDRPTGKLLWVNEAARESRILPGMRYAAGLSLDGRLRAAEIPEREIERGVAQVAERLRRCTPNVEPARGEPGTFWLDASGFDRLYGSLADWAQEVRDGLAQLGFQANLAVGFRRFGAYALARSRPGVAVLHDPAEEDAAVRRVPLDRLGIDPDTRDTLARLGVRRLGAFLDLPPEGIRKRFGAEAHRLYRLAAGEGTLPLQPERPAEPAVRHLHLDHPESDAGRLLLALEALLESLLEMVGERGHRVTALRVLLRFERGGEQAETLRPAAPTLDLPQLRNLLSLRAGSWKLSDGVEGIELRAETVAAVAEPHPLLSGPPRRDPAAADRALARVRARLGDGAVVRARLSDGHLPEARFRWEELSRLSEPHPRDVDGGVLVRRMYGRPQPLPRRARHEPDGWMLRGLEQGPVVRVVGPYILSGGWWNRPVHREYHFAETQRGDLLWVYYDRVRRRWFLQGTVE